MFPVLHFLSQIISADIIVKILRKYASNSSYSTQYGILLSTILVKQHSEQKDKRTRVKESICKRVRVRR
jgi:hypothetical protein